MKNCPWGLVSFFTRFYIISKKKDDNECKKKTRVSIESKNIFKIKITSKDNRFFFFPSKDWPKLNTQREKKKQKLAKPKKTNVSFLLPLYSFSLNNAFACEKTSSVLRPHLFPPSRFNSNLALHQRLSLPLKIFVFVTEKVNLLERPKISWTVSYFAPTSPWEYFLWTVCPGVGIFTNKHFF